MDKKWNGPKLIDNYVNGVERLGNLNKIGLEIATFCVLRSITKQKSK